MRTIAVLVALVAVGCTWGMDDSAGVEPGAWATPGGDYGDSDELDATQGALTGRVGEVVGLEGAARIHEAHVFDSDSANTYAYIELRASGTRGVAMQGVHIDRFDSLHIGDELHFSSEEYRGDGTPYVSVIGCSGPDDGNWDYDEPAEDVDLLVGEGPTLDTMRLTITARFPSYYGDDESVVGSVVVPANTL